MKTWDSEEVEVPAREERPDTFGFLKFLGLALGFLLIFWRPLRALGSWLGGFFSRSR